MKKLSDFTLKNVSKFLSLRITIKVKLIHRKTKNLNKI